MTRSRNASGFYFWYGYNYFNSYLDIRQDALKIFLLNLKIGIDILLNWVYIRAQTRDAEDLIMDYEEMILAAQEERDEWYDENEEVHEVYNPIIRQMMIEAGMKVN